jgi:hypothetical protein
MRSTKTYLATLLVSLVTLAGCSSSTKPDYEAMQKVLDASERTIAQTYDYQIRIKTCQDAIGVLNAFLQKHHNGDLPTAARDALAAWESKKAALEQQFNQLSGELSDQLRQKAIDESNEAHPLSGVENIVLQNRATSKTGYTIFVTDTYSVRMKGAMIGYHIFKLLVTVSGYMRMDSNTVFVDKNASVEE